MQRHTLRAMKLFLDDVRRAPAFENWVEVRRAEHAISLLGTGLFDTISLDFDLGDGKPSGETVLIWLEERVHTIENYPMPDVIIHTQNPVGRMRLHQILCAIAKQQEK